MTTSSVHNFSDVMKDYDPDKNITRNVMTRFEKTKIVGMRLEQLARGAAALVDVTGMKDIRSICIKELDERKIPFIVARTLPNGQKEYWRLEDMIIS